MITRQASRSTAENTTRRHKPDYLIIASTIFLLGLGLTVLVAISPALTAQSKVPGSYFVLRQLVAMAIGLLLFFIVTRLSKTFFSKIQWLLIGLSIISAALILVISGVAYRWIQVGGFSFQPAELVKFTIIIVSAIFLSDRIEKNEHHDTKRTLVPIALWMSFVAFVIVILERDLGSMMVMTSIVLTMILAANVPIFKIFIGLIIISMFAMLAILSTPYRRDRLAIFLQPEKDCSSEGYHACQAMIAIGSGGLVGLGLGNSVQAYGYLPEAANDSIFAIYAEKFGFIGSSLLIFLYGFLLFRILKVMRRAPDYFSHLVVAGVFAWIFSQTLINVGAMLGLLPLKGITLPLISYGGSSMMFVLAALGLVYRVSGYTMIRKSAVNNERLKNVETKDYSSDRRRYSRARNSIVGGRRTN